MATEMSDYGVLEFATRAEFEALEKRVAQPLALTCAACGVPCDDSRMVGEFHFCGAHGEEDSWTIYAYCCGRDGRPIPKHSERKVPSDPTVQMGETPAPDDDVEPGYWRCLACRHEWADRDGIDGRVCDVNYCANCGLRKGQPPAPAEATTNLCTELGYPIGTTKNWSMREKNIYKAVLKDQRAAVEAATKPLREQVAELEHALANAERHAASESLERVHAERERDANAHAAGELAELRPLCERVANLIRIHAADGATDLADELLLLTKAGV